MNKIEVRIRSMYRSDIPSAMQLKKAEGWNQTEKDWEILLNNKSNVNLVAEYKNGLIGTVTAINYVNDVAWIGMMIVGKEFRGQGVSALLLNDVIRELKKSRCKSIKLDATPAGLPVYRKLGFVDEYEIYRMTIPAVPDFPMDFNSEVEIMNEQLTNQIVQFDKNVFGADRKILLESLIKYYPDKTWLKVNNADLSGFVLGREGTRFHQVGPVSALNSSDAKLLIKRSLKSLIGEPTVVDILADKKGLYDWLTSIGFVKQRHFVRMYLNGNPFPGEIEKHFLICGPEFG